MTPLTNEILCQIRALIKTKEYADSGVTLVLNQGQALDGFSELAIYRGIIAILEDLLEPEETK